MSRTRLVLTGMTVAAVLSFGLTTVAGAAALFYNMTLVPTSGSLTTVGTGSFSIDSTMFTRNGTENFGPVGSTNFQEGLLSFNISGSPLGDLSMSNDTDYPNYPMVTFIDGVFSDANFTVKSATGSQYLMMGGASFIYKYIDPTNTVFTGGGDVSAVSAVPLPASLPLFLSGLAGIGLIGRKRRKRNTEVLANSPA